MPRSVGPIKITFVGASYLFVHRVARDFLKIGCFEQARLVVFDLLPKPVKLVTDLIGRMITQRGSSMRVQGTLNRAAALKDADVVILSISTGHPQAYQNDDEVCKKYGIWHIIGDTIGPAAVSRNLRQVPVLLDLARAMEKLCPKAVLINFTNPMSVTTAAFNRFSSIRCIGMCHGTAGTIGWIARALGADPAKIQFDLGGINHLAFIPRIRLGPDDVTARLYRVLKKSKAKSIDFAHPDIEEGHAVQLELFRRLGALPNNADRHTCEFFPWFLRKEKQWGQSYVKETLNVKARLARKERYRRILDDWAYSPKPVPDMDRYSGEDAHSVLISLVLDDRKQHIVNIPNDGAIAGLPQHACVEVHARVGRKGCKPKPVQLPQAVLGILQPRVAEHDLNLRAAVEGDRDLALQALHLDPLVKDFDTIPALLDDLLAANRRWLPQFKPPRRRRP
jgi:alpha-galactosidase